MKIEKPPIPLQKIQEAPQPRHPQVLEAAKLYEAQFLREMVKEMRKTIPKDGLLQANMAERVFQEQLDQNTVDQWVDRGGVGMADLIYDQIMEKYSKYVPAPKSPQSATQQYKKNSE